jgi:hypothetical protein
MLLKPPKPTQAFQLRKQINSKKNPPERNVEAKNHARP